MVGNQEVLGKEAISWVNDLPNGHWHRSMGAAARCSALKIKKEMGWRYYAPWNLKTFLLIRRILQETEDVRDEPDAQVDYDPFADKR